MKTEIEIKAKRIQRKRTKGYKMPQGCIYVGRPTKWGNPFKVDKEMSGWQKAFIATQLYQTKDVIEHYKNGDLRQPLTLMQSLEYYYLHLKFQMKAGNLDISELKGKNLACWCGINAKCHADILLKLANE